MEDEYDTPSRILRALRFRPKGMTITELAKQINMTRNSVSKHLEILQIAGKVDVRTVGNAKLYSLAQRVPMSAFLCFTKNLIIVLDSSRRIVQINDQCLKLLNRTKDDLIGLTLEEGDLPVVSTPEATAVIAGLEREQVVTDLRYQSDGKDLFFQMQVIPTTFEDGEKGATIVLEDITERKQYIRNMEFLARTAMELVDLPPEADIYQYIAERLHEVVPETLVFVESFDEVNRQFYMQAIMDEEFREGLKQLLGRDIVGMAIRVSDLFSAPFNQTMDSVFGTREHIFRPKSEATQWSFYDICFRHIPEEICEAILDRFNIGRLYAVGLKWEEQLFGMVGLFLAPGKTLEHRQAVESFLRQASIAMARRQTEARLRRNEQRFCEVVDFSPFAAAIIDTDNRYISLNRGFTELFGYTLPDIPTGKEWFRQAFPDEARRSEVIAAWQSDLMHAGKGRSRPRTFSVRCKNGEEKAILFNPIELCDGTQYITYEDVSEERQTYRVLVEEIADLRRQLASLSSI